MQLCESDFIFTLMYVEYHLRKLKAETLIYHLACAYCIFATFAIATIALFLGSITMFFFLILKQYRYV